MRHSDSCQYLQTAEYRDSCKQGAMPVLDSWYRAEGCRGTAIVQPQSWDQVSANNRLGSNANTEPVQISVLEWYRYQVPSWYQAGCKSPPGPRWKSPIHASIYKRQSTAPVVNKEQCLYWKVGTGPRVVVVLP